MEGVNSKIVETNWVKKEMQSAIGVTILLVSWAILFATLFLSYAILRSGQDTWPPIGVPSAPLFYPTLSTVLILLSSITYGIFKKMSELEKINQMKNWFLFTLLLGLGFLVSQGLLWNQLKQKGFYVESGIFSSIIYSFTWVHAAHVVLGILGLVWLVPSIWRFSSRPTQQGILRISHVGKFWHFLDIIWLIMYFSMFVF